MHHVCQFFQIPLKNERTMSLDERFIRFLTEPVSGDDEGDPENAAVPAFLASPAAQ